jgi:hypothetical protein
MENNIDFTFPVNLDPAHELFMEKLVPLETKFDHDLAAYNAAHHNAQILHSPQTCSQTQGDGLERRLSCSIGGEDVAAALTAGVAAVGVPELLEGGLAIYGLAGAIGSGEATTSLLKFLVPVTHLPTVPSAVEESMSSPTIAESGSLTISAPSNIPVATSTMLASVVTTTALRGKCTPPVKRSHHFNQRQTYEKRLYNCCMNHPGAMFDMSKAEVCTITCSSCILSAEL